MSVVFAFMLALLPAWGCGRKGDYRIATLLDYFYRAKENLESAPSLRMTGSLFISEEQGNLRGEDLPSPPVMTELKVPYEAILQEENGEGKIAKVTFEIGPLDGLREELGGGKESILGGLEETLEVFIVSEELYGREARTGQWYCRKIDDFGIDPLFGEVSPLNIVGLLEMVKEVSLVEETSSRIRYRLVLDPEKSSEHQEEGTFHEGEIQEEGREPERGEEVHGSESPSDREPAGSEEELVQAEPAGCQDQERDGLFSEGPRSLEAGDLGASEGREEDAGDEDQHAAALKRILSGASLCIVVDKRSGLLSEMEISLRIEMSDLVGAAHSQEEGSLSQGSDLSFHFTYQIDFTFYGEEPRLELPPEALQSRSALEVPRENLERGGEGEPPDVPASPGH